MIIDYNSIEKIQFKDYQINNAHNIEIINQLQEFAEKCFENNVYFVLNGSMGMKFNFNKMYRDIKDIDLLFKYKEFDRIYDIIEILNNLGFNLEEGLIPTIGHKEKRYASNLLENISDDFDTATTYIIDNNKFDIKNTDLITPFFDKRGVFHDPNGKNSIGFNQVEKAGKFFRIWFKNTLLNPSDYEAFIYYKNDVKQDVIKANFSYNEEKDVPFNDWWCSELLPTELLNSRFEYRIELKRFYKNFSFANKDLQFKFELHINDFDYQLSSDGVENLFYNEHKFGVNTISRYLLVKKRYNRQKDFDDLEFYFKYKNIL